MNLDDAQKKKVTEWIAQGLKLSEIQKRLGDELGLRLTYMEARLLVDDLKLMPKDTERPKPLELSGKPADQGTSAPVAGLEPGEETAELLPEGELPKAGAVKVKVKVDQIAQPDQRVVAADRAFAGLVGASRADHRADDGDRVRALEDGGDDGRCGDHPDEIVVEELPLVHRVVLLGHRAVHLQKTHRDEAQSAFLESREDLEGDAALKRIGF